jgi:hypothetical protein
MGAKNEYRVAMDVELKRRGREKERERERTERSLLSLPIIILTLHQATAIMEDVAYVNDSSEA